MKKNGNRYREEQIIYALRQVDGGRRIAEVCRELGVAEQTYHRWKKRYAEMGVSELRRLSRSSFHCRPKPKPDDRALRIRIKEIAAASTWISSGRSPRRISH